MNPFVLFLFVTFQSISLVFGSNENLFKLLNASELREKYILQRFLGQGKSGVVYLIKEKESGSEGKREFALKHRISNCKDNGYAFEELKALRFVTTNDIPFANRLIHAYHCPYDMDIAEESKDHFAQLLEKENHTTKITEEFRGKSKYPITGCDESSYGTNQRSMCFVIEYASQGTLMGKREIVMQKQFFFLRYLRKYKYAKSLLKWTMQMLTSFHWLHQNDYIHKSLKGENIAIDANDNVVVIDFGRSKNLRTDGKTNSEIIQLKKMESTYLFFHLLVYCDTKINLNKFYYPKKNEEKKFNNLAYIMDNFSLELCQENWKKWNGKRLDENLLDWLVIPIAHENDYEFYKTEEEILQEVFGTTPM
eukprot:GHVR01088767.1.p1 GENE.GHVR01088767.1~~GHVR01088767.1.p1  ORF type:complete len:383 (+),score=25.28 GHVR01088767.1:57-1151(+)